MPLVQSGESVCTVAPVLLVLLALLVLEVESDRVVVTVVVAWLEVPELDGGLEAQDVQLGQALVLQESIDVIWMGVPEKDAGGEAHGVQDPLRVGH